LTSENSDNVILASLIVIRLEHMTPGVTVELDAVRRNKRADVAIVLLPEDSHEKEIDIIPGQLADFAIAVSETQLHSPPIAAKLDALITKAPEPR
jgi:hypothetical protein